MAATRLIHYSTHLLHILVHSFLQQLNITRGHKAKNHRMGGHVLFYCLALASRAGPEVEAGTLIHDALVPADGLTAFVWISFLSSVYLDLFDWVSIPILSYLLSIARFQVGL